jgi:hypothetical protein
LRGTRDTVRTGRWISDVVIATLIVVLLCGSCATRKAAVTSAISEKQAAESADALTEQTRAFDELKRVVEEQIATADRRRLEAQSRIRTASPYFYKRFELYPSGTTELQISLETTDVPLKPYEAAVSVPKARFTTRYHTSRSACADDSEFIRDIGTQWDTYSYESGEWNPLYSLFEIEKTSILRDDTWEDVTGAVDRMAQDEPESFFGRVGGFFRRIF